MTRIRDVHETLFLANEAIEVSLQKGYIHFWCKMTHDRSHSDTVGRVANKVRVERG